MKYRFVSLLAAMAVLPFCEIFSANAADTDYSAVPDRAADTVYQSEPDKAAENRFQTLLRSADRTRSRR